MLRHLPWTLLFVGCAAAPPPEPRVVERVVYVEAPCKAPILVERDGHREKAGPHNWPTFGHRAKPNQAHGDKWAKKQARRCDKKPTAEARERCHRDSARR